MLVPALHILPEAHFPVVKELIDAEHEHAKQVITHRNQEAKAPDIEHKDTEFGHFYKLLSLVNLAGINP